MIKFIEEDDENKLKNFYHRAYGSQHILNNILHQNWQFQKNPFNKLDKKSILIYEKNKMIACHFGLIPNEIKILDSVKEGAWYVSVFTLPEFRKQGLASSIIKFSNRIFSFEFALNISESAKRVYIENGWTYLGTLNRYVAIIDNHRFEKFIKKTILIPIPNFIGSTKLKKIKKLTKKYDNFWNHAKKQFNFTTNRSLEFMNWRYLDHPLIDYHFLILEKDDEIVGYAILRFELNNEKLKAARIVDMIILNAFENEFIKNLLYYCKDKADFVDFFCTGDFYKKSLEKNKFFNNKLKKLKIPTVFNPIDYERNDEMNFIFHCNEESLANNPLLKNVNHWYVVKGDSDQDRLN